MNSKRETKKKINLLKAVFITSMIVFFVSLFVLFICVKNRAFAETYCNGVSYVFRYVLAKISGIFPFSVAEISIVVLPFLIVILIIVTFIASIKRKLGIKTFLMRMFSTLFILGILFINTFAVCYLRNPIDKNMGLDKRQLSREQLYESAMFVKDRVEEASKTVDFKDNGSSENPYGWKTLNEIIDNGFESLVAEYPFISDINAPSKKILLSRLMTYTHISGIYIPFTGEANVNTNYPDYVVAFSAAHEKAHQRGIAGEDEANFVAFLACLYSDDDYLKYVAYMNMYDYFLDSVLEHDIEMYRYLVENTDQKILREMYSYYLFFEEYRDSAVSEMADEVNDTYLKTMGDNEGTKSYGKVIELFAAYMNKQSGLAE